MPEILFDMRSNISIDVCLDALAQNLIDACESNGSDNNGNNCSSNINNNNNPMANNSSTLMGKLGKDSPPSKLLCARDIANYKQIINQYYKDISLLPSIKESDIIAYMKDVSKVMFSN